MSNLPPDFIVKIKALLGAEFDTFLKSLNSLSPVSVRLNPLKRIPDFDSCEKVQWATDAYYLQERISFTMDPLFHAGCYYVQEASSMFLESALRQLIKSDQPVKVLDLCAAPGGKSTHILNTLPEGSLLVSNEVIASRNNILQQNLTKWGYSNAVITQNDAADFSRLPGFFDVIVVDAPCSGEGLFRKQPDAVQEWSEVAVANCAVRQTDILDKVYDSLKEGGFLIYSTCTFEASENENQCRLLIEKYGMVPVLLNAGVDGIIKSDPGLRFYPHLIKGEGFFIAALKKAEAMSTVNFKVKQSASAAEMQFLNTQVNHAENFIPYKKNEELYAFPKAHYNDIQLLMDRFYVRKAGLHLGTIKGKDLVPDHELALSLDLNSGITRVELSKEEAIKYLRCESIILQEIPKGWAVVTYRNFPLGWIKGIGNRINNYFPRPLRILMAS